jgi:hypothetical protein
MRFTPEIQAAGAGLLHQQCWQWGYDIRRTEGNLLIEYGFRKTKCPERQATRYSLVAGRGRVIELWGFGFFTGRSVRNGIYVNRYEFLPRHANASGEIWEPGPLAGGKPVTLAGPELRLLAGMLRWIARYEDWVLESVGVDYRRQAAAAWGKAHVDPLELPARWRSLAGALQS